MNKGGAKSVEEKSLYSSLEAVVKCKDCVHWDELTQACDEIDGIFLPDWFCAEGVKKDE